MARTGSRLLRSAQDDVSAPGAGPSALGSRLSASGSRLSASGGGQRTVGSLLDQVAEVLGSRRAPGAEGRALIDESRELIAAFLDRPRHWPVLNADTEVPSADWDAVMLATQRRAAGAPMPYAVGKANFRALTLAVDERVLIPRPETEQLVDLVLEHGPQGGTAVDVCTGSGATAIALATEGRFEHVIATDISRDALDVARANAARCGARVEFVPGDLLAGLDLPPGPDRRHPGAPSAGAGYAVVVSNPPYIAYDEAGDLPASVRDWEPPAALFSSDGGLAHTARLVAQAAPMLQDEGLLALEADSRRAAVVAELVARDGRFEQISVVQDLTGRERFVLAIRRRRSHK